MKKLSSSESKQKNYYNSIAHAYDVHYHSDYALKYRYKIYDEFLDDIDISNYKVLDAMCGGGENTSYFKGRVSEIEGIDVSEEQCKIYKQRHPYAKGRCGSILNTPYKDDQFDLIVVESLHHLHPHVNGGINEIKRILKPGGYLFIWEPLSGTLMDWFRKLWYKKDTKFFEDNEASISLDKIKNAHNKTLELRRYRYGGNIAYLLVSGSMFFRLPVWLVKLYARPLVFIESIIDNMHPKFLSCWVAAVFRKTD